MNSRESLAVLVRSEVHSEWKMSFPLSVKTISKFTHGAGEIHTCFVNPRDIFPHIPQIKSDATAHFPGSAAEFLEKRKTDETTFPAYSKQMNNKVRVCTCGKPVAFTLANCNGCGLDLTKTPITTSTNIFSSFIYGIQKGGFPFTISMRAQTKEMIVFDDLLALTACHLNVIPTDSYIPDWRYLCNNPGRGLKMLDSLFDRAWSVVEEQFLGNAEWKAKILRGNLSAEELKYHLACGCNYPPSQYQFHLQYMLPPFLPQHWLLFLKDMHFTYERFFPIEYIRAVLSLNIRYPGGVDELTKIEDVIAFYNSKGVNYDKIWKDCYARYADSHKLLSNWSPEGLLIDDVLYTLKDTSVALVEGPTDIKTIQNNDKMVLQNYGRPYNETGKPTGGYYSFARDSLMEETFINNV